MRVPLRLVHALEGLGRGPLVVPGGMNQFARTLLGRLLPRTSAIAIDHGAQYA